MDMEKIDNNQHLVVTRRFVARPSSVQASISPFLILANDCLDRVLFYVSYSEVLLLYIAGNAAVWQKVSQSCRHIQFDARGAPHDYLSVPANFYLGPVELYPLKSFTCLETLYLAFNLNNLSYSEVLDNGIDVLPRTLKHFTILAKECALPADDWDLGAQCPGLLTFRLCILPEELHLRSESGLQTDPWTRKLPSSLTSLSLVGCLWSTGPFMQFLTGTPAASIASIASHSSAKDSPDDENQVLPFPHLQRLQLGPGRMDSVYNYQTAPFMLPLPALDAFELLDAVTGAERKNPFSWIDRDVTYAIADPIESCLSHGCYYPCFPRRLSIDAEQLTLSFYRTFIASITPKDALLASSPCCLRLSRLRLSIFDFDDSGIAHLLSELGAIFGPVISQHALEDIYLPDDPLMLMNQAKEHWLSLEHVHTMAFGMHDANAWSQPSLWPLPPVTKLEIYGTYGFEEVNPRMSILEMVPPTVRDLTLESTLLDSACFSALPPNLTRLRIGQVRWMSDGDASLLPRSLRHLDVSLLQPTEERIRFGPEFFALLPPHLEVLDFRSQQYPVIIKDLLCRFPQSIRKIAGVIVELDRIEREGFVTRALHWLRPDSRTPLSNSEVAQVLECLPFGCTLIASYWRRGDKDYLPYQLSPDPPLYPIAYSLHASTLYYSGNEDTTQEFESETLLPQLRLRRYRAPAITDLS